MVSALATLVFAASGGAASAQTTVNAPPGNSAVDQYLETIPSAGGSRPTASRGKGQQTHKGGTGAPAVPSGPPVATPKVVAALRSQGASGKAAADFVEKSAPRARPTTFTAKNSNGSSAVPSVITRSLTGSDGSAGGMGAALPILMGLIAVGGIVVALRRRQDPA